MIFPDSKNIYSYQNLTQNTINASNLHCEGVGNVSYNIWALNPGNGQYEYRQFSKNCPFSLEGDIQWFRVNGLDNHPTLYSYVPSSPSTQLSPVINGLSESINEFIPYVVYVGLGVLGALIGFFAIKRLMNRVKRQSFGVFSSRKRK